MSEKKQYDANSIQHLSFREGARKRVGVYLGSADNEGVLNGLLEIVNNSTDEANAGFGNVIEIGINDKSARVRDYGRGLPRGRTDKSEEIMVTLLTENHSGAKFDKSAYAGFSRGLNGSGGGATCVTSDWMEVTSWRDGYEWNMRFEEGVPTTKTAIQGQAEKRTGTLIEWQPSQSVFSTEEIHFDYDQVCKIMEEYSYFNIGTKFICKNYVTGETRTYLSKRGILDFAEQKIVKSLHKNALTATLSQDGIDIEVIAKWTGGKEKYYLFVNGAECPEGGAPLTGAKTAITRTINNLAKKSFSGDLVRQGLVYIIAIKHPEPIFANQIKSKISNPELRGMTDKAFSTAISEFAKKNRAEFEKIVELLAKVEKADVAAEKARSSILGATKEVAAMQRKKIFAADKLKDAEVLGQDSMLLIAEGNSAMAALMSARDTKKYGILAIRGKLINCLSNPDEKINKNEEVLLILGALGISPNAYNAKKLRYGKVGIATDADSDGDHIGLLIMGFFQKFMPKFLEEGRLFWMRTPLYIVNGNRYFYTDEEFLREQPKGKVVRCKGLGKLNPDQAKESMFGKQQRLDQLSWSKEAEAALYDFLSEDVSPRKEFLFNKIDFSEVTE